MPTVYRGVSLRNYFVTTFTKYASVPQKTYAKSSITLNLNRLIRKDMIAETLLRLIIITHFNPILNY